MNAAAWEDDLTLVSLRSRGGPAAGSNSTPVGVISAGFAHDVGMRWNERYTHRNDSS